MLAFVNSTYPKFAFERQAFLLGMRDVTMFFLQQEIIVMFEIALFRSVTNE